MTLAQLRSFVAVVRLGSVRAAAAELGVSEPAISSALAALRKDVNDELLVRVGRGLEITPGGRRLAARAVEILGLASKAYREVAAARGEDTVLRVGASSRVAEDLAPALIDAFRSRSPRLGVALSAVPAESFADHLTDHSLDVTLGPRVGGADAAQWVPFLRHHMVIVAAPTHPLAERDEIAFRDVAREPWLAGPLGHEPLTTEGVWLSRQSVWPPDVRAFPTHAEAVTAAAEGYGITMAPLHRVRADVRARRLRVLTVRGTPVTGFWYGSVASSHAVAPAAVALLRFLTTPDATQAMLSRVRDERFRPPVHITLWS
jgi:LysR family transcriptional regulator, low CO2-responsive transcriptional regulator